MSTTTVSSPSFLDQFGDAVRAAFRRLKPAHHNARFADHLSEMSSDDARVAAIQDARRKREALNLSGPRVYNVGADLLVV